MTDTTIFYNDAQFYLLFNLLLWMFIFYLGYKRGVGALLYLQLVISFPIFLFLTASSYLQGIPYGYAVAFVLMLTSGFYAFMPLKLAMQNRKKQ